LFEFFLLLSFAGGVHGVVHADPSGEPIPHAAVVLPALGRRVVADERGYFVLAGMPAGTHRISASAIGHESATVDVVVEEGRSTWTEIRLKHRAVELPMLEVAASPGMIVDVAGPGAIRLDVAALKAAPALAEADVFRAVQTLPSVSAASDFSSALYVRGGSQDHTLVTLDGAPLFNPFHLAGLFSAIDVDAVSTLEVHSGALPARRGDRLSGAVDIWTRDGGRDRVRVAGGVGLVSSRASIDGPLPGSQGSFLASIRRTYVDAAAAAAYRVGLTDGPFPYSFTDGHFKATHDIGRSGRVSGSLYVNDERFRVPAGWGVGSGDMGWGSLAGSVNYRQALGSGVLLRAHAAATDFRAELHHDRSTGGLMENLASSRMQSRSAGVDLTRFGSLLTLSVGVGGEAFELRHEVAELGRGDALFGLEPLNRRDAPHTLWAFAEGEWTLGSRLQGRSGVRLLRIGGGATVLMPRAGVRLALSEHLALTGGAGTYAQAVQTLRDDEALAASLFAFDLIVAAPASAPPRSHDVVAGVEWSARTATLRVEGYQKWYRQLGIAPLAPDPKDAPALAAVGFVRGDAVASGVEVLARKEGGIGSFTLSYTLTWSERTHSGVTYTPRIHRRHVFDAGALMRLGSRGQVSSRLVVASGQPYTPVVGYLQSFTHHPATGGFRAEDGAMIYGPQNSARGPFYARLDAGIRRSYDRWFFGREGTITPYVQVLNLLNLRNVLWMLPEDGVGEPVLKYGPQLPTLPTIGFEWRF
jgi:hypothetical protein